ncbi:MAG: hypothetical protein AB8E15_08560 [Bdellovibrionales bacterium]
MGYKKRKFQVLDQCSAKVQEAIWALEEFLDKSPEMKLFQENLQKSLEKVELPEERLEILLNFIQSSNQDLLDKMAELLQLEIDGDEF